MFDGKIKKFLFLILGLAVFAPVHSQIRSGSAFLKMLPGARIQSMAAVGTAVLDDPHAIFANPANTSFLREWQWSASYTKWIADISNASFVYGHALPLPWSRHTRVALGLLYQGVPEFNNDATQYAPASANDFVASFSIGQPLGFISQNLSVGGNIKYFKSTLAQYSASSMVCDFGITARTAPFRLTKSFKSVLSLGAAMTQNGSDVTFIQAGTPLPKTFRTGLSVYLGAHKGLQMLVSADYVSAQDEQAYMALGGELMINRFLGINAGYNFGSDLMKNLTLGASIRLDHVGRSVGSAFPGKDNAFRLDVATLDESEFFSRTYRGSATHFPTKPEAFVLRSPAHGDSVFTTQVVLRWHQARDLDVYDHVTYRVLADQDSANIANILSAHSENPELFMSLLQNPLDFNRETIHTSIPMDHVQGGDYYWAVVAMDADQQIQIGQTQNGAIARFTVPLPDIEMRDIVFEPNPEITTDEFQGLVRVTLANVGEQSAKNFTLRLVDEVERLDYTLDALASTKDIQVSAPQNVLETSVSDLQAGESRTFEFEWNTPLLGRHKITATIESDEINELNSENNSVESYLYTVPKGEFSVRDSVSTIRTETRLLDMPLITQVYFDSMSARVPLEYTTKNHIDPVLPIVANRLQTNPEMYIELKGYADPNSNETQVELANARSAAVRDTLLKMGVKESQIQIVPGAVLPVKRLRSDSVDTQRILQERRFVDISTTPEFAAVLLRPQRHGEVTVEQGDVRFASDVSSVVPLKSAILYVQNDNRSVQHNVPVEAESQLSTIEWRPDLEQLETFSDAPSDYYLTFVDSLDREFRTPVQTFKLNEETYIKQHVFSVPLQFGKTDPMSQFYWQEIFDYAQILLKDPEMHLRFEGHACSIGPAEVNKTLSMKRAKRFDQEFRDFLKTKDPAQANAIEEKIAAPVGWGEDKPLSFEMENNHRIVGHNDSPVGRNLNRRIELVLYKNGKRL